MERLRGEENPDRVGNPVRVLGIMDKIDAVFLTMLPNGQN
jgi:hypothetical protein